MDPIANMFTKIKNAQKVGHQSVTVTASKAKSAILEILQKEGYIKSVKKNENELEIKLKYQEKKPAIQQIERVSKPGCRVYSAKDKIPYVLSGKGRAIISTSKGLKTDKEARKEKIGGEVICKIY